MVALRVLLMVVVTAMSLLGPVAAAERAAERAGSHQHRPVIDVATDLGDTWSDEARLFYCQVASSILPDHVLPQRGSGSQQDFPCFTERAVSRHVPPGDKPPRGSPLQATLS
ncbi:hypothetical protein IGS74_00390 [Aureimonas sp. OT7]|uniref:hypothetical protein n=1 Tax=Aureimonas TaxID=414371 RepID=UPI00177D24C5|nr:MULTISPECIES: hypothetical protein [Aureimonas]QOG06807.1 hypothetical protein IGS74_00390 [Aureimonas sp. OT7]